MSYFVREMEKREGKGLIKGQEIRKTRSVGRGEKDKFLKSTIGFRDSTFDMSRVRVSQVSPSLTGGFDSSSGFAACLSFLQKSRKKHPLASRMDLQKKILFDNRKNDRSFSKLNYRIFRTLFVVIF